MEQLAEHLQPRQGAQQREVPPDQALDAEHAQVGPRAGRRVERALDHGLEQRLLGGEPEEYEHAQLAVEATRLQEGEHRRAARQEPRGTF